MNYQHIYHAGNFSEVVKHAVIVLIMEYLQNKPNPLCFMDTHAGMGVYDLKSIEALKTEESLSGIQSLMKSRQFPETLQKYVQTVLSLQKAEEIPEIRYYPGSPWFIYANMRPQDRLILNEYHPLVFQKLKENLEKKPQIFFHHRDAYEFLPAVLPPAEGRGLVVIDPPFENKNESLALIELLQKSLRRWSFGVYLIWFPITAQRQQAVSKIILENQIKKYLMVEFTIAKIDKENKGLLGCQLLVVNPPWNLDKKLSELLPYLWRLFSIEGQGGWSIEVSS